MSDLKHSGGYVGLCKACHYGLMAVLVLDGEPLCGSCALDAIENIRAQRTVNHANALIERDQAFADLSVAQASYVGARHELHQARARVAELEADVRSYEHDSGELLMRLNALETVLREVRPFVDPDATAVVDELARRFYRDTGLMAPGKSVALEMANSQPPDDVRREKYYEWVRAHREAFCRVIDAVLASATEPDLPDLDLLRKLASGEGGRRTGDLMRRGWLRVEVKHADSCRSSHDNHEHRGGPASVGLGCHGDYLCSCGLDAALAAAKEQP